MLWAHPDAKHGGRGTSEPFQDPKATGQNSPLQVQELLFPFSRSFPFPIDTQHPASAGSRYFSLLGIRLPYPPGILSGLLGSPVRGSRSLRASCPWPLWFHLVALTHLSYPWAGAPLALCLKDSGERLLFKLVSCSSGSGTSIFTGSPYSFSSCPPWTCLYLRGPEWL